MARLKTPGLVVCDAGPLIHLDELRCLDILAVYRRCCVPDVVWQEVKRHRPSALRRRAVKLDRIEDVPGPTADLEELFDLFPLHPGEFQALCLLVSWSDAVLLSDDGMARAAAEALGRMVKGTIGLIVDSLDQGQRTKRQVLRLLESLPRRSTLHASASLLGAVIAKVREDQAP